MSVPSTTNKVQYTLASTVQVLPVSFYFLDNSHLKVVRARTGVADAVLVLNTDYTVTGAGDEAGGNVTTIATNLVIGDKITIIRNVPLNQLVNYVYNDKFPAEVHERALDKLTMIAQQYDEQGSRNIQFPETEPSGFNRTLSAKADRENTLLAFDENGDMEEKPIQEVVDEATAAASASAAAAAASASASAASATDSNNAKTAAQAAQGASEAARDAAQTAENNAEAAEAVAVQAAADAGEIVSGLMDDTRFRKLKAAVLDQIKLKLSYGRKPHAILYGDSLTNGSTGGSWPSTFIPAWERLLGRGGSGCIVGFGPRAPRDCAIQTQASFGGWTWGNIINWPANGWSAQTTVDTVGNFKYAFDGMGVYKAAAAGTEYIAVKTTHRPFTRATLFYLEHVGGGSFNFGKTGDVTAVNCSGAAPVVRSISRRIWDGTVEDSTVLISGATGSVYLFGLMLENDEVGGMVTIAGRGGEKAETFAQLDATSFSSYITAFDPSVVVFNLGTNDTTNAATYKTNMQTLITRVRNADATVPIALTVHFLGQVPSTYLTVLEELVVANTNVFLLFWEDFCGANGTGYLYDTVHPNAAGCALIGEGTIRALGGQALHGLRTLWPWRNAPLVRNNIIADPTRNSNFTAAATDWAVTGGGAPSLTYVQNVGLQVVSGSTFTGIALSLTTYMTGGSMKAGKLYHIRLKCSVGTGVLLYPIPGSSGLAAWPWNVGYTNLLYGQVQVVNGEYIWMVRPAADITDIRLLHPGAGVAFTVSMFEIREIVEFNEPRTVYAAGTVYALTATQAAVTFGTTSPSLVLDKPGRWKLKGRVVLKYNAATFAAVRTATMKLRRTNNTATDVANSSTAVQTDIVTTKTMTLMVVTLPEVVYGTPNYDDAIALFGALDVIPTAGSLDVVEASIVAELFQKSDSQSL